MPRSRTSRVHGSQLGLLLTSDVREKYNRKERRIYVKARKSWRAFVQDHLGQGYNGKKYWSYEISGQLH